MYSHAVQFPKGKTEQNKNPEMTHYTPPWHLGISACSIKCQSSSFHFWSFWQLIPLMCLFPSPRLSSFPCQMPKASTAHCCITKHSNLCSVLPTEAVLWELFKFQESTLEKTKPERDTYNICYFIYYFKAILLLAWNKTSLAFRVSCTGFSLLPSILWETISF